MMIFSKIGQFIKNKRAVFIVLASIVVSMTTYTLILPAFTLEKNEAKKQGGISIEEQEEQSDISAEDNAGTIEFKSKEYGISLSYGEKAGIPEEATLDAEEIKSKDKKEYNKYLVEAEKTVKKELSSGKTTAVVKDAKFFDISIVSNGEEIEPEEAVQVQMAFGKGIRLTSDEKDAGDVSIVHFTQDKDGKLSGEILDSEDFDAEMKKGVLTQATFEAESFSVYGIIYTVDFHYSVDGESFDYSIDGGESIMLSELLKHLNVLGASDDEQGAFVMDDIEAVKFSDSRLIDIEKDGSDYKLTSLKPFDTEETLTITLKNGDSFVVNVTDDQEVDNVSMFDGTSRFVIWSRGSDDNYYALKTDGSTAQINLDEIDDLDAEYQWTISYGWHQAENDDRYYIRPFNDPNRYLTLQGGYTAGSDLVRYGQCGIRIYHPGSMGATEWKLEGWNWVSLNLGWQSHVFEGHGEYSSAIHISKQAEKPYTFRVRPEDIRKGLMTGTDSEGVYQNDVREFVSITDTENKLNLYDITADPAHNGRYIFDYWDLNGVRIDAGATIPANSLTIPYNGSTLTAHFKNNPDYVVPDEEKEGHSINKDAINDWLAELAEAEVFDGSNCDKTAELYDYENRIYRVDLTAKSSLPMFKGDIDLGFMLDVSGSMKFPSKLDPVPGKESVNINYINDNTYNQYNWLTPGNTYYIISDKGSTATVYEIRWGTWIYNSMGQTRTGWGYKDASKDDSSMQYIRNESAWSGGEVGLSYPIYIDGDPGHKRLYYLEKSINSTIAELNSILTTLSAAQNVAEEPKVKIAWNTFAKPIMSTHHEFTNVQGITVRPNYATSGGTSIDMALLDAAGKKRSDDNGNANNFVYNWNPSISYSDTSGFEWEDDAVKFAVLITDGAPQRNGIDVDKKLVNDAADLLKNGEDGIKGTDDDITLITVGLSMGDVKKGSVVLYDIANLDDNNEPLFYKADTGDELQYVLYEMLRQTIMDAIVESDITDTLNEAFYPVDKETGSPLGNNNVIDLNGVKIGNSVNDLTDAQKKAGYGTISESNGTYTVTWVNQNVSSDGWHGTIYEKAKEDFFGGNAVRTNEGQATLQARNYKNAVDGKPIALKDEIVNGDGKKYFDTPRVNVNELDISRECTEWTVYLGTEIKDLKDHLKKLYESIRVRQVIRDGQGVDTDGDGLADKVSGNKNDSYYYPMEESALDSRESDAIGSPDYLYLKDFIKQMNGGNDIDFDRLIALSEEEGSANTGISFTYNSYGQDNPGKFIVKLIKDHSIDDHVAEETGTPVETYTLDIYFEPMYDHIPAGQGGDDTLPYHTGTFGLGSYGNAAGTEDCISTHKINVFAKKFEINKVDQEHDPISSDNAEFALYRKATADELSDSSVNKVSINGLQGSYVLAQTLTTDNGVAISDQLPLLPNSEPYYLIETKAPAGYYLLEDPLMVSIDMENHNTWTKKADGTTSQSKPNPYALSDWLQEATITITDVNGADSSSAIRVLPQGGHGITYDHENDTTDASVTYKIINREGVELPSAGGPGTTWIYILGALLILGCGIAIVVRQRCRH